jgi:hypothetical protein
MTTVGVGVLLLVVGTLNAHRVTGFLVFWFAGVVCVAGVAAWFMRRY